jgi:hypothetical protein
MLRTSQLAKAKLIPNMSATTAVYAMASHSRKSLNNPETQDGEAGEANKSAEEFYGYSQHRNGTPDTEIEDGVTDDEGDNGKSVSFPFRTFANTRSFVHLTDETHSYVDPTGRTVLRPAANQGSLYTSAMV